MLASWCGLTPAAKGLVLPQVHPRKTNSTNKIGIGIPKAQSKIHPTFPFSLLRMAILHFFQAWRFFQFLEFFVSDHRVN